MRHRGFVGTVLLLWLLALLVPAALWAQSSTRVVALHTAEAGATANGASANVLSYGSVAVQWTSTGTWNGTLNFEKNVDGVTWVAALCHDEATQPGATLISSKTSTAGYVVCGVQGSQSFRARISGRTQGAVTVTAGVALYGLNTQTAGGQAPSTIYPSSTPSAGQLPVGNAGGSAYAPQSLTCSVGTCTFSSAGVLTIPSTGLSDTANLSRLDAANVYTGSETLAGANGQSIKLDRFEEALTLAAAATSDTTGTIPANARTRGAVFRITTTITGCTTVTAGIAGATTRFGTFGALTSGTTLVSTDNSAYSTATAIRFSCSGGGGAFTAGVIRTTPFYDVLTAPTS